MLTAPTTATGPMRAASGSSTSGSSARRARAELYDVARRRERVEHLHAEAHRCRHADRRCRDRLRGCGRGIVDECPVAGRRPAQHRRLRDLDAFAAAGRAGVLCLDRRVGRRRRFSPSPTEWKRCDSGGDDSPRSERPPATYAAAGGDVGATLKADDDGSKGGSAAAGPADSAATAVIARAGSVVPPISGDATDGAGAVDLGVDRTAPGRPRAGHPRVLLPVGRCGPRSVRLRSDAGATTAYMLTPDDVADAGNPAARHEIRVQVTRGQRRDRHGAGVATGQIAAQATQNATLPQVARWSGSAARRSSRQQGRRTATGIQDMSYRWIRCDPPWGPLVRDLGHGEPHRRAPIWSARRPASHLSVIETVVGSGWAPHTWRPPFSRSRPQRPARRSRTPVVPGDFVDERRLSTTTACLAPSRPPDLQLPLDALRTGQRWIPARDSSTPVRRSASATSATYHAVAGKCQPVHCSAGHGR